MYKTWTKWLKMHWNDEELHQPYHKARSSDNHRRNRRALKKQAKNRIDKMYQREWDYLK